MERRVSDALVLLRRHRRPGYKQDLSGAAGAGAPRHCSTCRSSASPARAGTSSSLHDAGARQPQDITAVADRGGRSTSSCALLRYVDGDYDDAATFDALRQALGAAQRPLHYLAIPPEHCSPVVIEQPGTLRAAQGRRAWWWRSRSAAISPRRGRSTRRCTSSFPECSDLPHRSLPRQGAGAEPPLLPLRQLVPRADLEPQLRRQRADHDGGDLRRRRAAASSTRRPAPSAT